MRRVSSRFVLFATLLLLWSAATNAFAQPNAESTPGDIPRTISYQGTLTGPDGKPQRDGQYSVTVRLYTDPDGAQAIYNATYQVQLSGGLFSILLGSGHAPLPPTEKLNSPLWIGITFNGHEELKPYTALSASPYALNVPNNAITSDKLQDGAVTSRKIAADYVGSLWIDGDKITDRGSKINLEGANGVSVQFDIARNTIVFSGSGSALGTGNKQVVSGTPSRSDLLSDGTAGNFVANGNVDLGGGALNPQIKFTGKAASGLDMNSNNLSNVAELFLGHAKSYSGSLTFYSATNLSRSTLAMAPQSSDRIYTIPDGGTNAQFILSEGTQSINGTKTFTSPITGTLNGNAKSATSADRAAMADQVANTWVSGASIISALMANGGTLTNNTLGNAKTATLANAAVTAHTAEQSDAIANTYVAGASIDRALHTYNKPLAVDISGAAARALNANEAIHAAASDRATEILATAKSGASVNAALTAWNGTLSNNTDGNAATVTNGVYVTGRYNDPLWIASLAGSKITGTVASANQAAVAVNAMNSEYANSAKSATRAFLADQATKAISANSAQYADSADHAQYADHATNADRSTAASIADRATTASSVTNGLYSTGHYADPSWLTSLSASKLTGAVPNANYAAKAGSAAPEGAAGGNLGGSYPNPSVIGVDLTAGNSIVDAINHSTGTISAVGLAKNLTIYGGSINASPIGTSMPAPGAFTISQSTTPLGANSSPLVGGRYSDNNIVAWGDVTKLGVIQSQFGGAQVVHTSAGVYTITLPDIPAAAAIEITSQETMPMLFSAQRTGQVITVRAFDPLANSVAADGAFYFLVVTRPQ